MKKIAVFAGANARDQYLDLAYEVGKQLANAGFLTITGGGPGMMRAVNRGAHEAKGESWGICIRHRSEQIIPGFFTHYEIYDRFDERNDRLLELGDAFIALPGGLGTIVEALQITQRKKFREVAPQTPMIFLGSFYKPLTEAFKIIQEEGFISDDLSLLYEYIPTPEEMIQRLINYFQA